MAKTSVPGSVAPGGTFDKDDARDRAADRHSVVVGERTHRAIAEVLRIGFPAERSRAASLVVRTAHAVLGAAPVEHRPRETLVEVATSAGVYLRRFVPQAPWTFEGAEVVSGRSRFDIVYHHPRHGYLVDEVKLGRTRIGETAVREQVERYLAEGRRRWGSSFAGVRLCALNEPLTSRFYLPSRGRSVRLFDVAPQYGLGLR